MDYLFVAFAVLLLAFEFALSKKYQTLEGTSMAAGLRFNILSGLFSAVIMWAIAGFRLEWSLYSAGMALGMSLCCLVYSILGFQMLKEGGMTLYSTFLMSGGMLLPYFFGVAFLDEILTPWRILGVVLVLASILITNISKQQVSKKLLAICCAVFVLNGCVSIISKCHQISTRPAVSSAMFVTYAGVWKCLLSIPVLLLSGKPSGQAGVRTRFSVGVVAAAALISGGSYLLQLLGAKTLPATVLYPMVTGGSVIFSALAGKVFFKETITKRQKLGIALCFLGTLLFL